MTEKRGLCARLKEWLPSERLMLIFVPVHGFIYEFSNHFPVIGRYYPLYCRLDEILPVVKWFVIPYCVWFPMMLGTVLVLWKDRTELKRYFKYLMITVFPVYFIFLFYPTTMPLRPDRVEGKGILELMLNMIYAVDDPTNIMPSLHVIWAVGAMLALMRREELQSPLWKAVLVLTTVMISLSTFMIKQHSALDVIAAIPFCLLGWWFTYRGVKTE